MLLICHRPLEVPPPHAPPAQPAQPGFARLIESLQSAVLCMLSSHAGYVGCPTCSVNFHDVGWRLHSSLLTAAGMVLVFRTVQISPGSKHVSL